VNDRVETQDPEPLRVLADARCREHRQRSIGVVVLAPGGFPSWESRHRGRASVDLDELLGIPDRYRHRDTLFVNLRETSHTEVEGWYRDCRKVRRAMVADLLEAARSNRRAVVLV
jgi:hypothetical protein